MKIQHKAKKYHSLKFSEKHFGYITQGFAAEKQVLLSLRALHIHKGKKGLTGSLYSLKGGALSFR
jgi:hypothetical protein